VNYSGTSNDSVSFWAFVVYEFDFYKSRMKAASCQWLHIRADANKQTVSVQHDNAALTTGQRPLSNSAETTTLAKASLVDSHKLQRNGVTAEG
jgi:hypothetical protein